ncbi:hypothetical protein A8950_1806 [Dongia mobilis]|uniref:Uncharacterized protein n=1 Tax=Dongia mobilis TaxID=578943 RepID=A0A4R6WQE5_9PROT|nr:hypothetical protein A8950_1806 [Dongia mobilis]
MYRSGASFNRHPRRQSARAVAAPHPVIHRIIPLLAVLATVLLLAACVQPGHQLGKDAANPAKTAQKAQPGTTPGAKPGTAPDPAAEPAPEAAPATVAWSDADQLMGLGSEDIRAALGAPARIREEEPAQIYQYVGGDCVLDLFLYQEAGIYRVTYAEARSVKAEHKPVEACLRTLPAPIVAANTQPST